MVDLTSSDLGYGDRLLQRQPPLATSARAPALNTCQAYPGRLLQSRYPEDIPLRGRRRRHQDPTNPQDNFGLLHNDLTPKPAYTDIQNMISDLKEATWNSGTQTWSTPTFTPGSLDYTMSTASPTINHLLLQKSNGDV